MQQAALEVGGSVEAISAGGGVPVPYSKGLGVVNCEAVGKTRNVEIFFDNLSSSLEVAIDKPQFTSVSSSQLEYPGNLSNPSESNRMSRTTKLEQRLKAQFDQTKSHFPLNHSSRPSSLIAVTMLVLLTATMRPGSRSVIADEPAKGKQDDLVSVSGRVVGPSGQAIEGAKLYVVVPGRADLRAVANHNGEFEFQMQRQEFRIDNTYAWSFARIVAVAEGYPPEGAPYPAWVTDARPWPDAMLPHDVRIEVPRGVLVRGKVIDAESKMPIMDAGVEYWVAEAKHFPHVSRAVAKQTYWGAEYRRILTRRDGTFEVAVIPGPGYLVAKAPDATYVSRQITHGEVTGEGPGGYFMNIEAAKSINPKPGEKVVDFVLEMTQGVTIRGQVVGPDGKPIDQAVL